MDDDLLVVIAHSLLGPAMACQLGATLLLDRADELPEELRDETLARIKQQAQFTSELLLDLVRGGNDALLDTLDSLNAGRTGGRDRV